MKFSTSRHFAPLVLLVGLLPLLGLGSCSNTDCPLQNTVSCHYSIYSSATGSLLSLPDSLTVRAADTTLLNRIHGVSTFSLPMSYVRPADTLYFRFANASASRTDTVVISHTNTAHFVSLDCGTSYYHKITGANVKAASTSGSLCTIDSIVVVNPDVTYDLSENLRLYLHTN